MNDCFDECASVCVCVCVCVRARVCVGSIWDHRPFEMLGGAVIGVIAHELRMGMGVLGARTNERGRAGCEDQ